MQRAGLLGGAVVATVLAALAGGCMVSRASYDKVVDQRDAALAQAETLQKANKTQQLTQAEKDRQIESLQALGGKRLDKIFHVQRIELGQYTGGADLDDRAGDDAVRVYLKPIDQDGATIKAAGSVTIELYDLAAPKGKKLIGTYTWTVDQAAKTWTSFVLYHYKFDCKWKSGPPAHDDVTVRVAFVDYLSGKRFTAQTACKVKLAPTPPPKTAK